MSNTTSVMSYEDQQGRNYWPTIEFESSALLEIYIASRICPWDNVLKTYKCQHLSIHEFIFWIFWNGFP